MRRAGRPAAFAAAMLAVLGARAAAASNVLVNGGFTSDLSGWTTGPDATASWIGVDAAGAAGSGSVSVTSAAAAPGAVTGLFQCVAATPGASYDYGGLVRVTLPSGVSAFIMLSFFSGAGCSGDELSRISTDAPPAGAWTPVSGKTAIAPDGTASARVFLVVQKAAAGGAAEAFFDAVYLNVPLARLVIPAAASIHGQNGAFFHTDIWLLNRSYTNSLLVTARFRCFAAQTCPQVAKGLTLSPRASTFLADAIGTFFGAPETAGAIELEYDPTAGDLSVTSRTYTPSVPDPTYGTAIPASPVEAARARAVFLGLGNNGGDLRSGFRTNAGAFNPNDVAATVTLTLYGSDGVARGAPVVVTLGPREARQVNDVFGAAGAGGDVSMDAYLVADSSAPVFAYVTVIDNQSGDSVFVPASDDAAGP
ncbi:MAG TPA: hypothetical protein VMN04_13450 [Thermoanaerobaculia bacterium]|nr:hypothetical protein [Thermoanaerobaculia bacterium]